MDIPMKIKMVEAAVKVSEAELAKRLGTTPQALGQRMKTGKFSTADLERIAEALGVEFQYSFRLPDGTVI